MAASDISLQDRLKLGEYNAAECSAAIRGEKVPFALGLSVTRLCVIRGIRYHTGFATELYGLLPEFTRALNARSIMSNAMPDMTAPDEFPYCIWYPDLAAESTYRELARQYPQMRYNVGRACAVAGYIDLYRELQLLPDVSIAEEARDNQKNHCDAIFAEIMAQPTRYAVMDDYTRSVNLNDPRAGACLNGDTAVRSLLQAKQKHVEPLKHFLIEGLDEPGHDETHYFNIVEDWGIDDYESELPDDGAVVPLLYSPLPADLPTVNKDLLILVAAFYGNIDRYTRLRRPTMILGEYHCVVRGIYHDTMYAKWWSLQPEVADFCMRAIRCAINARFIMNNDLSRITEETDEGDLPYQIWYPYWAHYSTYEELARRKPSMKAQAARACIVADYKESYNRIQATPDYYLVKEAQASHNPYYLEDLKRRAMEMHIDIDTLPPHGGWKRYITRQHPPKRRSTVIPAMAGPRWLSIENEFWYDGHGADISPIELFVSVPDSMKPNEEFPNVNLEIMYLEASRPEEYAGRGPLTGGRVRRLTRGRGRGCGRGRGS